MSKSKYRWAALILVFGACACLVLFRGRRHAGPWSLTPAVQRIEARPGQATVMARYEVRNLGKDELRLGRASTSCGCSAVSVEPDVLAPGGRAVITVEGHPPEFGERTVEIKLPTNRVDAPVIVAGLIMVGAAVPPYVVGHTGPLNLGVVRRGMPPAALEVETIEPAASAPWVGDVASSAGCLAVEGRLGTEVIRPDGLLHRKYRCRVSLAAIPEPGPVHGEIALFASGEGRTRGPVLRVPVLGTVRPAVFARPSILYAGIGADGAFPELRVSFESDEPDPGLSVEPSAETSGRFRVRRDPEVKGIAYKVIGEHKFEENTSVELTFVKNREKCKEIVVPLFARKTSD